MVVYRETLKANGSLGVSASWVTVYTAEQPQTLVASKVRGTLCGIDGLVANVTGLVALAIEREGETLVDLTTTGGIPLETVSGVLWVDTCRIGNEAAVVRIAEDLKAMRKMRKGDKIKRFTGASASASILNALVFNWWFKV